MTDFACMEDEVLTSQGCVNIDELTGSEVIIDSWNCETDGNQICGAEVSSVELARTGQDMTGLAVTGSSLIIVGALLARLAHSYVTNR